MKPWQLWIVGCVAMAAIIAGAKNRKHDEPPSGIIQNVRVLQGGDAIVLWRRSSEPHDSILGRVDKHGATRWWRFLPETALFGEALSVGEGVIAVRYSHEYDPRHVEQGVAVFTLEGERLWNHSLGAYKHVSADGHENFEPSLDAASRNQFIHRGHLLAWANNGESIVRSSIDLATGIKADAISPERRAATIAFGAHLVEDDLFEATSVDLVSGTQEVLTTHGRGCRVGNDFVVVETDRKFATSRLVSAPDGDFARRTVLAGSFRPVGDAYFSVRSCGAYADKLVFLLSTGGGEPFHAQTFIAIATRSGQLIRVFSLGDCDVWFGAVVSQYPDRVLVGGRVSRFVPFVQMWTAQDAPLQSRIIIADLETGTVAEGPNNDMTWRLVSVRDAARWYLRFGNIVAVLDGATGQFVGAVQVPSAPLIERLVPDHISDGKLWISTSDDRAVDSAPLVVLDATNLQVIHSNGVPVIDVSSEMRANVFPVIDGPREP